MNKEKSELFKDWINTESEIGNMYARDEQALTRCNVVMMKCVANAKEIVEKNGGAPEFAWPVAIAMFSAVTQKQYPDQM